MTVIIIPAGRGQQKVEQKIYRYLTEEPHIQLVLASALRIELLDVNAKARAKFHITDIRLRYELGRLRLMVGEIIGNGGIHRTLT